MTKEERKIVLRECEEKQREIDLKKESAESAWTINYNAKYRLSFAASDILDEVVSTKIGTGIVIVSVAGIYSLSHSWSLSLGIPACGALVAILGNVSLIVSNGKKKMEYWKELETHEKIKSSLDEELYPYRIVSEYLRSGQKYLLHQYRQNLDIDVCDEDKDEFDYLDIDTTNLSPLMVKALAEMKEQTMELSEEMKRSIIVDINNMHTTIVESDIPIPLLMEYQKVLKKYMPQELSSETEALTK